jgi:hypothetical protein
LAAAQSALRERPCAKNNASRSGTYDARYAPDGGA